jgi:poly(3-hydroxybutyrate) depolymerase
MNRLPTIIILSTIVLAGSASTGVHGEDLANDTTISITKTWSQQPAGWTYPMTIRVPANAPPEGGFPVCILLHGNGGNGGMMVNEYQNQLTNHALVAPSGYQSSWNICSENSEAPDVEMIDDLMTSLQGFDNVNPNAIRIIGSSNGASLANRVILQTSNPGLDTVCSVVSQLSDAMVRGGSFYRPDGNTTNQQPFCGYQTEITPVSGRRYLGISNENDGVIPYFGGWSPVGVGFIDSRLAAYEIARTQGYTGKPLTGNGEEIGSTNVFEYEYLDGRVIHLRGFANHGMNPTQREYIVDYLSTWPVEKKVGSDLNDDGQVNGADLGLLIVGWGGPSPDLDGSGTVGGGDLGILLADWTSGP